MSIYSWHNKPVLHRHLESEQYTSIRYTGRLTDVGALASIGSVGDSYDNAMAESLIGLYKTECVRLDGPFKTVDELELATLSWVHWYNEHRLHPAIGHVPPIEYEAAHHDKINPRQLPGILSGEDREILIEFQMEAPNC